MKYIILSIVAVIILVGAGALLSNNTDSSNTQNAPENATVVDGKQIIEIDAKGGYSPRLTKAKAGVPTVIKVKTRGTFDCSSALTIPSIGYRTNLPPSGETEIELPAQPAGSTLQGLCSMGMYNFQIRFD